MVKLSRPGTPLCSNSTAIPIGRIGEGLPTRERMLGTHYFMPAHLVPAVEVVSSKDTRKAVADRVSAILKSVGKVPVRVGLDIPGFLGARLQAALSREAIKLVERGIATPEDIDNVVRYGFGFRYVAAGPLLQRDHAGVDVHCAGAETIYPDLCNSTEPSPYMSDKVRAGHIGMKAKKGFYDWTDEAIAAEKERYERALIAALEILQSDESMTQRRRVRRMPRTFVTSTHALHLASLCSSAPSLKGMGDRDTPHPPRRDAVEPAGPHAGPATTARSRRSGCSRRASSRGA